MATVNARAATSTYNTDVFSIVRRYNRVIVEVTKSQSSGISYTLPFDVSRLKSYVNAVRKYMQFVAAQPLLDCPETGPTEIALPANPSIQSVENESAFDVLQLVEIARDELSNSQSGRMPTNLLKFDYDRQMSYLEKIEALLAFVEDAEPLDLPESSPMVAMPGPGARGVNVGS